MRRSTDRILTTHVGALHRPEDLQEMIVPAMLGEPHDEEALARRLREAVRQIVSRQLELGIDIVDDGEFSKVGWGSYVMERLNGLDIRPATEVSVREGSGDLAAFSQFYEELGGQTFYLEPSEKRTLEFSSKQVVCVGNLSYSESGKSALKTDIDNIKSAMEVLDVDEAFLPVVAPGSVQPYIRNEHYATEEELFEALASALRTEYEMIIEAGLICQIDDAFLPFEWDRRMGNSRWDLESYRRWAELSVEALNSAIKGLPEDRLRYHICWGSWNGPHSTDIQLDSIVDLVLKVNAQAYSIEAANCRHEFEYHVWERVKLPDGKILIPGVIEHTTNVVEHPETVADRIMRFANIVGRENLIAGTDCGFRARSHPQVAWAKLKALADGAAIASERLWR